MNLLEQADPASNPDYSKTYSDEHGEYRFIPLTQGQFAKVDAADFEWIGQWKWYAAWCEHTRSFYAVRQQAVAPSAEYGRRQRMIRMHRTLLNEPPTEVDHHDCNTLNNRRYNLRKADDSQNGANRAVSRRSSTGFKGVSRYVRRGVWTGQWRAQIKKDRVNRHIGYFPTPEAAHAAYVAAAQRLHGEFFHAG